MILETIPLAEGLFLTLHDQTRHYFGGYYHVKVLVSCDVPVIRGYFADGADYDDCLSRLGGLLRFERVLEKMAVPEAGIEDVRSHLMQTFRETSNSYLTHPDFAARFVRNEYTKALQKSAGVKNMRG